MTKNSQLKTNVFVSFVAIIFWLTIFELLLRLFWNEPGYGYPKGLHIADDTKAYKYQPNFKGFFPGKMYKNIPININSKGLRDEEHDYEKIPGVIRILGLGDSATFGSGISHEGTYLKQLENKFKENGYKVETINTAVSSYEFDQEYTYYFEEGYKYKPDLVILGLTLNDARMVNVKELEDKFANKYFFSSEQPFSNSSDIKAYIGNLCKVCKFSYFSVKNLSKYLIHGSKDYNQEYFERVYDLWQGEGWDNFTKKLITLNKYLIENNSSLLIVIFPYTQQFKNSLSYGNLPQEKIIKFALDNHISYLDLESILDLPNFKEYYVKGDDVHLNEKGNKMVSDVLYSKLTGK